MEEDKIKECIVKIRINGSHGTGFFIEKNKILTCFHVVEGALEKDIKVVFNEKEYSVEILDIKEDPTIDLALLKVEVDNETSFKIDKAASIKDKFQTYGFADDEATIIERGAVPITFKYEGNEKHFMKFKDGQFEEGHSGSPIINLTTKSVCGVLNASRNTDNGLGGYGIPIDKLNLLEYKEKNHKEIKLDAINILKMVILGKRDFKKLSQNNGKRNNKEQIYYEYFYYNDGSVKKGYVFLGKNIINKNVFKDIKDKVKKDKIDSLEIFLVKVKNNHGNIIDKKKDISKNLHDFGLVRKVANQIHYIDDSIWENTIESDQVKNVTHTRKDFIDQIIYTEDTEKIELSLDFLKQEINHQKNAVSIIYGSGGVGKTTLCNALEDTINQDQDIRKKVFYIKGEKIVDILHERNQTSYEINSLDDLYSLYKDENNFLDFNKEIFRLNYISGNIIVIIDALEEIESALGDRFVLKSFLKSLMDLNENFFSTKIIITTREPFYTKIKEIYIGSDIQYLKLLGFTSKDLDNFLIKRYRNDKDRSEVKEFIKENKLFDEGTNGHIIPLFVDWVCKIIERPDNNRSAESEYFLNDISIDKLLIKLINREIDKQSLSMDLDGMFKFLEEIILEHNGVISKNNFTEYIEIEVGDSKIDNYIKNPLFIVETDSIKIKYDVLIGFVKARSLRYKLMNNQDTAKKLLTICHEGNNELYRSLINIFNKENSILNFKYQIKYLTELVKKDEFQNSIEKENVKKSISAILYISFKILIQQKNKLEYTNLLKKLYDAENSISYLFIYGEFYPLDFREIHIHESEFIGYQDFIKCSFPDKRDRAVFFYTCFKDMNIQHSNKINSRLFEKCEYVNSNIKEIIDETDDKEKNDKDKIYKDISSVCKKVGESQKLLKVFENERTIKSDLKPLNLLTKLIKIGLLEEVASKSGTMYRVSRNYYDDLPDIRLCDFPSELMKKIDTVFFE